MKKSMLIDIIASLLTLLFVYTAISKLIGYSNFKFQLTRSPFITGFSGFVAWSLPSVELATGLLLCFQKTRLVGLYTSFFLLLLFTGYIYAMLHYSTFLPCSCGGVLSAMTWNQHIYFNLFFLLLCLTAIMLTDGRLYILPTGKKPLV